MIKAFIRNAAGKILNIQKGVNEDDVYERAYSILHRSRTARSAKIFLVNLGQYKHMEALWK